MHDVRMGVNKRSLSAKEKGCAGEKATIPYAKSVHTRVDYYRTKALYFIIVYRKIKTLSLFTHIYYIREAAKESVSHIFSRVLAKTKVDFLRVPADFHACGA